MKCICFLFRLHCFLPQFTDFHSANFMLNCISQGYGNLHTLCLHRVLQVKLCLLTENDTMTCCQHTNFLLMSVPGLLYIYKIFFHLHQAGHCRITHKDKQCSHYAENRVYAFRGQGCVPSSWLLLSTHKCVIDTLFYI